MEEKVDILYSKFMDTVLDLAEEFQGRETLTENEAEFLNAFDEYVDEVLLTEDEE